MNKFKKLMCLFLSVLMILSMGIPAFAIDRTTNNSTSTNETQKTATTTEKNPLTIEISTNKADYKVTNVAEITATVTNTGKEDIKNVSAEAVFNDLAPVSKKTSETKKEVETLKAGESISFTYKATLNANEHKLNLFQKIFLWFVRLFNGGYTPSDNGLDNGRNVIEQNNTISFGKFNAVNTVRVWYGEQLQEISDEDFNTFQDIRKSIENLSKNDEVINILEKEMQRGNVTNYQIFDNYITYETAFGIRGIWEDKTFFNSENKSVSLNNKSNFVNNTPSGNTYTDIINKVTTSSIISSLGDVAVIRPYRSTDFQYDDFLTTGEIIADTIGVEVDTFDNTNATLSVLRNLDDYGIVLIDSHGSLIENEPFICLTQTYSNQQVPSSDLDSLFINQNNEIRVSGNFFQENYDNNFDECFVFLGTCYGMFNNSIADALISNGVDCVYGYTNPVSVAYCNDTLVESMLENLLLDLTTSSIAYNNTVSVCGRTDPYNNGTNFVIQQSNDFCLSKTGYATGTVKDNITNKALSNVVVKAMRDGFVKTAKTNKNGEFKIELPVGKWEISVEDTATHYCHKKLSVTIEENVETVLINHIYMTRKTGEALCAVYDKTTNNAIENVKIEAIDISSKPLISSYDEFKKHEIVATATTDSKGLASLDLPYGSYLLAFTHDNYEYYMKEVEINAELDISAYDVKLTPKGSSGEDDRPVTASGDCGKNGDNVKWVLYDDGELVISGQGRMADYSGNDNPWNKHKESITSITIEDGVTYIGNASFYNSINLESISFPASLLQIGADAFNSCISLKQLVLPNRLTSIGAYAFYKCEELVEAYLPSALVSLGGNAFGYCKKMKDIVIPEGLCSIGEGAFWHCESITKFSIPSSVELIGQGAFGGCYTCSAFAVSKSNKKYSCYESVLFDKEKKVLINYPIGNTSETYIIPDTVEIVQSYAFGGHPTNGHLSSIEFGANLKCFESNVFEWGGSAQNKIHDVYYKGTLSQWCEIDFESRESNPCYNGSNGSFLHIQDEELTELKIPSSITNIKPFTFCGINNIQKIKFHNNVTNIGDGAFESCHSLKEVKIPDSTVYIASEAFSECPALEYVSLPKNITVDNLAFSGGYDNSELTIVLDGGICTFKGQAFWNHSIAHVHYNGTMQDWCSSHFSSYYSSPAWFGSDFTVDGQTIKANYSNDISIIIPDGVEKINDYAFSGRYINPENFYIPKSIKYIGEHIFDNRVGAVIYQGSEEEWNAVTIEPDNANLNKAAIQFLNN